MTLSVRKTLILSLLSLLILHSCSIPDRPVSKEEALALAHRIERSVTQHDYSVLNRIFDEKAFAAKVTKEGGIFLNKSLLQGAMEGFHKRAFGKEIIDMLGENGSYELIKHYEKDHKQHLLFRFYSDPYIASWLFFIQYCYPASQNSYFEFIQLFKHRGDCLV